MITIMITMMITMITVMITMIPMMITKVVWRKIGRKVVAAAVQGVGRLEVLELGNDCCRNADEDTMVETLCHVRRVEVGCPLAEQVWRRIDARLGTGCTRMEALRLFGGNEAVVERLRLENINMLLAKN